MGGIIQCLNQTRNEEYGMGGLTCGMIHDQFKCFQRCFEVLFTYIYILTSL